MIIRPNKTSKLSKAIACACVVFAAGFLFYVSLEARHAEERYHRTLADIAQEEERINLLKSEIAYLSAPSRLERIAKTKFKQEQRYAMADATRFIDYNDIELRQNEGNTALGLMANINRYDPTLSSGLFVPPVPKNRPARKTGLKTASSVSY